MKVYDYSPKWQRVLAMKPIAYLKCEMRQGTELVEFLTAPPSISAVNHEHPDYDEFTFYLPFLGDVFLFMENHDSDQDPEKVPNTELNILQSNIDKLWQAVDLKYFDRETFRFYNGESV